MKNNTFFVWHHEKSVLTSVSLAEFKIHMFKTNSTVEEMSDLQQQRIIES